MEVRNAKIVKTFIGLEDHAIFTFFITFDYGQAAGGYCIENVDFIRPILKVLKKGSWEELPGSFCRVNAEHAKIHAIGHLLEDSWVDLGTLFEIKKSG